MRTRLLHFLRVPPHPTPPQGAPQSVRIFRAGRNYYYALLLAWSAAQIGTAAAIITAHAYLNDIERSSMPYSSDRVEHMASTSLAHVNNSSQEPQRDSVHLIAIPIDWSPDRTFLLIRWLEYAGIALFIIQIPLTFFLTRIDFEQHWYIVTDRSLRIRRGIWSLKESTMSFANIQQVEIKQGPLQRFLRIADVRVQSAGGGQSQNQHRKDDSMHLGIFHGVDNPQEIRDLILARLKSFRQAGLGDHDDAPSPSSSRSPANSNAPLSAARTMLNEARELHKTFRN